ncbi:MAG: VWA domain-containing protein, partial [Deltaproteobacteria bacterium]|nr:VWA domain-containing protein [Deltaproteobacteria bacterium]
ICGILALLLSASLGCDDDRNSRGHDTGSGSGDGGSTNDDPEGCISMDILFVIDNSGSMQEEQSNLATNFPLFIQVLDAYQNPQGDSLDYRVAVATTDTTGTNAGRLVGQSNCDLGEHPWVEGPADDVVEKFSCMANVGITGAGEEMPFVAIEEVFGDKAEPGFPNYGFFRVGQQSLLVLVIITDEDDRSTLQAQDIKDFLDQLSGGPGNYVVIGIGGPSWCSSAFGEAEEAYKIMQLIELVSANGVFGDICAGDLWVSLEQGLAVMEAACDEYQGE